jgi:hypothetical protein
VLFIWPATGGSGSQRRLAPSPAATTATGHWTDALSRSSRPSWRQWFGRPRTRALAPVAALRSRGCRRRWAARRYRRLAGGAVRQAQLLLTWPSPGSALGDGRIASHLGVEASSRRSTGADTSHTSRWSKRGLAILGDARHRDLSVIWAVRRHQVVSQDRRAAHSVLQMSGSVRVGGAEGIRTPDLLIAKASPACLATSAPVYPMRLLKVTSRRGCAGGARNRQA